MRPPRRHGPLATYVRTAVIVLAAVNRAGLCAAEELPLRREFSLEADAEVTVALRATCVSCDWSIEGQEAAALRIDVDGRYSQHVLLTRRGEARYAFFIGTFDAGRHVLTATHDAVLSAKGSGAVVVSELELQIVNRGMPEHSWLAEAPILHARRGTIERFSDVPLAMYVEALPEARGYRYTVIFSHEDGGTPTDRLMATWGRSTDIEFVYEVEQLPDGITRRRYQGPDHEILPFTGKRAGSHPLLWVSTDNNMVSDSGPNDVVRFALTPQLVDLTNVSREVFMDANPWLYAIMTAELVREGRIDPAAAPGSGNIPHPLQFAYVEACGELRDATMALDVGVEAAGRTAWYPTDRGNARFRIARSGCFRTAVPLPAGTSPAAIRRVRARAYTRPPRNGEAKLSPGAASASLSRVNGIFMLNAQFTPVPSGLRWVGTLEVPADRGAVEIPLIRDPGLGAGGSRHNRLPIAD